MLWQYQQAEETRNQKKKTKKKSRNKYNETKQNQGQKIIKHKHKNHKWRRAWRSCRGEAAICPRAGLAYCVILLTCN